MGTESHTPCMHDTPAVSVRPATSTYTVELWDGRIALITVAHWPGDPNPWIEKRVGVRIVRRDEFDNLIRACAEGRCAV
jgi:hypothetical protein